MDLSVLPNLKVHPIVYCLGNLTNLEIRAWVNVTFLA